MSEVPDVVLTNIWLEAPLLPEVLALLPPDFAVIAAAPPPGAPWSSAAGAQAIVASSLVRYTGDLMDACPARPARKLRRVPFMANCSGSRK